MATKNKELEKLNYKTFIDIKELPETKSEVLFEFVKFLKKRTAEKKSRKILKPKIKFQDWPLKIRSKLIREEIYGYL